MKLWLLSQNENISYGAYDSCVVVAQTAEEAKRVHPNDFIRADEEGKFEYPYYSDWVISVEKVNVKYIGEADRDLRPGVICASVYAL